MQEERKLVNASFHHYELINCLMTSTMSVYCELSHSMKQYLTKMNCVSQARPYRYYVEG